MGLEVTEDLPAHSHYAPCNSLTSSSTVTSFRTNPLIAAQALHTIKSTWARICVRGHIHGDEIAKSEGEKEPSTTTALCASTSPEVFRFEHAH